MPTLSREYAQKFEILNNQVQALNNSVECLSKAVSGVNDKLNGLAEADRIFDTGLKTANLTLSSLTQRTTEQGSKTTTLKAVQAELEGKLKHISESMKKHDDR